MSGVRTISAVIVAAVCVGASAGQTIPERLESARTLIAQGAARKALEMYQAVLPEIRRAGGQDQLLNTLIETAKAATAAGEYGGSVALGEEAVRTAISLHDGKREGFAWNLVGQAQLYLGSYGDALKAFQRALDLAEAQQDREAACVRLSNIGNVHFFQGRYLDALHSYEAALDKSEQAAGRQLALANMAILYEQLGQNEKALELFRRAQASASALQPNEYAQLLSNMGTLYRRMGDPLKALETYDAARRVFRRASHSDGEIHVLHNTGLVLALDYQAPDRALAVFGEALRLANSTGNRRQSMLAHLFRGEALLRLKRFEEAGSEYSQALAGAKELGAAEEQWSAQYGIGQSCQGKGNTALAAAAYQEAIGIVESLRGGLRAATLKTEFLGNKRSLYDAHIALLLDSGRADPELMFDLFEKARSRNLQDSLSRKLERATMASVQKRLDGRTMLVEYWVGAGRAAALWITDRAGGIVERRLQPEDPAKVARLAGAFEGGDSSWRADAAALAQLLFGGLPLDKARPNLLIVPDGILCSLPFDVLPAGPGNRMLVENFAVSYLPAAAVLLRTGAGQWPVLPWKRQLLAFGDPLPSAGDELSPAAGWSRLPAANAEVHYAARGIPGGNELHLGADNLKRYISAGAAAGVPVVHFSTHAAVDMLDPNRSRILFTAEKGAGGSRYLFWQEVQQLPLGGVDLVTLAACDTEGGKLVPGEGIQSFSRAFLAAGVRSTVTALWRVADRPTAEFMRIFYDELGKGVPKGEALRRAKVALMHSGTEIAEPRFWAAFVLTGDGRAAVPLRGWSILIVPIAGVTVAAAVVAAIVRRWRAAS
jgi:tetratricopeptide (TPR) repeat protein